MGHGMKFMPRKNCLGANMSSTFRVTITFLGPKKIMQTFNATEAGINTYLDTSNNKTEEDPVTESYLYFPTSVLPQPK
jgi:hypothetical protein